jgi:hypothetical protein
LIYAVPVALAAAHASGAPSSGWGGTGAFGRAAGIDAGKGAPLVLVQRRGGGGGGANRGNVNRGNVNRGNVNRGNFNSGNFQRDVSANRNVSGNVNVNRNVSVSGGSGYYGPNWGGVAAGVAVGAGVAAMASSAAASSASYQPPPYQYYPSGY